MSREVTLPSGAVLSITPASFSVSKELYQAVLADFKNVPVNAKMDLAGLYKELVCIAFASPAVEKKLWECFLRCTYKTDDGTEVKVTPTVFEPVERRDDFVKACMEVARDNIGPFGKSLFALYQSGLAAQGSSPQSTQSTTTS